MLVDDINFNYKSISNEIQYEDELRSLMSSFLIKNVHETLVISNYNL